jgi:flagellar biosynthesis/type III secretory pathway protein FliH
MRFINPKTDFGFKKIFGSEQSEGGLISIIDGILDDQEIFVQDQRNAIVKATRQAIQQEFTQGFTRGFAQEFTRGFAQGFAQGSRQAQFDMARRSLPILDDGMISQLTGLTIEEVQALRLEV